MEIYLVRHGSTPLNEKGVYFGWLDPALSEKGRAQAADLAHLIGKMSFDKVYASPLKRCLETAEASLQVGQAEMVIDERLKEINFGEWEGMDYREIEQADPQGWQAYMQDWQHFQIPGGESFEAFYGRVRAFAEEIMAGEAPDRQILIVAHQGVLRIILTCLLELGQDSVFRFHFEHAKATRVGLCEGYATLKAMNI